jgi:hypothetical protein
MRMLEGFERGTGGAAGERWHGDPEEPEGGGAGSVDWRGICNGFVSMERNWRWGRCEETWVSPPGNTVWRIKMDEEQGTLLSTSRTGALLS